MPKDTLVKRGSIKQNLMPGMMTVELKQVRFFAHHGLYPDERKTGNEFEVNLSVSFEPAEGGVNDISATVNYAALFDLVKRQMEEPASLMESLVTSIAANIKTAFPQTKKISVAVEKLHPPIAKFTGQVCVTFQKEY
jgi:dihydroneopterin aldolase